MQIRPPQRQDDSLHTSDNENTTKQPSLFSNKLRTSPNVQHRSGSDRLPVEVSSNNNTPVVTNLVELKLEEFGHNILYVSGLKFSTYLHSPNLHQCLSSAPRICGLSLHLIWGSRKWTVARVRELSTPCVS